MTLIEKTWEIFLIIAVSLTLATILGGLTSLIIVYFAYNNIVVAGPICFLAWFAATVFKGTKDIRESKKPKPYSTS